MEQVKKIADFNSFARMLEVLPTDTACRNYLEMMRWNGTPTCPHCGTINENHYKLKTKGEFKGMYKCKDCKERFTVTVGTMFEGSHISLRKWFIAMYIFSSHKKGISSHQLARDLGITQKSSWFMLGRIRNAYEGKPSNEKIDGLFMADETFVGGKNKNRHADKKVEESQGRSCKDKTPVFGIMQLGGKVHTTVVPDTKAKTLKPIIANLIEKGAIIVTDEWGAYNGLSNDYGHVVIKHNENEYVKGAFHTNGIENFWSLLKRGLYGIYHHASAKHLHRYTTEFQYRFNSRKITDSERFDFSLRNIDCKMSYKQLIQK